MDNAVVVGRIILVKTVPLPHAIDGTQSGGETGVKRRKCSLISELSSLNGWSDVAKPESRERLTTGKCGEDSTSSRLSIEEAAGRATHRNSSKHDYFLNCIDILKLGIWWTMMCFSGMHVTTSEPNNDEQLRIKNSTIEDMTSASCLPDVIVVDSVLNKLLDTHKPKLNGFIPLVSAFWEIRYRTQMKPFNNRWFGSESVAMILNSESQSVGFLLFSSMLFLPSSGEYSFFL